MKIKGKDYIIYTTKKPKENAIIIEGFPGLGFISAIVSNYLIHHLNAKRIGYILTKKLSPLATIHKNNLIYPIEIFYDEKNNIVIIQTSTGIEGVEYDLAEIVVNFAKKVKAKEIITVEGVTSTEKQSEKVFFFTTQKRKEEELLNIGLERINEGIIVGVSGALLLTAKNIPLICLFAETSSEITDNRASARIIKVLDDYLNLDIDYRPLLKKAEKIERKIKDLVGKILKTKRESEKRKITYAG